MTQQEIFDHVAPRLLKQNRKAMLNGYCILIANNGDRCAFGMLLPKHLKTHDELLDSGFAVDHYFEEQGISYGIDAGNIECEMYEIHNFSEPHEWRKLLTEAAKKHNLNDKSIRRK